MKISVLLFIVGFLHVSANGYGQETKLTIKEKNVELGSLLSYIETQSEFLFYYNNDMIDKTMKVNVNVSNSTIAAVLDQALAGTSVTYQVIDRAVILTEKRTDASLRNKQGTTVSGTIIDETGSPVPGVNVVIKGSIKGVVTDFEGKYTIEVPNKQSVLVFSFIGFKTAEIMVGDQHTISMTMEEDAKELEEVVVIAYGTAKKTDLTGSVSVIGENAIKSLAGNTIDQKLTGQVAGVQVQAVSGAPGSGSSIRIRGYGSFSASSEPLYVVDGMPYASDFNQNTNPLLSLNPSEIESITVLKDASSTAIYGSRGANGVIMITTKQGKAGRTNVGVDVSVGLQEVPQKGRPQTLNAREFAQFQKDITEAYIRHTQGREPTINDVAEAYRNPDQYGKGTDWYDECLQKGWLQNYNLNVSKGTDNVRIAFNLGYMNQEGVVKYSGVERYSGRFNIDATLGKYVRVGGMLSPSFYHQTGGDFERDRNDALSVAQWISPIPEPYDENGELVDYFVTPGSKFVDPWDSPNPVFLLREKQIHRRHFQNLGNLFAEVKIIDGLVFRSSLNTRWDYNKYNQYVPSYVGLPNDPPNANKKGRGYDNRSDGFNWLFENTLTYSKNFGDKHRADILVGYTTQKSTNDGISLQGYPYSSDAIRTINGATAIQEWDQAFQDWSMISYLARLNYTYNNRYLLTASFRSDGSSRFGPKERYANFPSVALAWRAKEEDFLKGVKWISDAKLRASYGTGGNNNIGNYAHLANVGIKDYTFNDQIASGRVLDNLSNPFLTWEESKQFDLGLDWSMFNHRVALTVDYYYRRTHNMLFNDNIPTITGYATQLVNNGSLENKGVEISLKTNNFVGDFSWTTLFNFSLNRNKVLSLNDNDDPVYYSVYNAAMLSHKTEVGKPIGQYIGYRVIGFHTAEDIADPKVAKYNNAAVGSFKYKDVNGDGKITVNDDAEVYGSVHPDFIFSMSNSFAYKNFDLNIMFNGQYGGKIFKMSNGYLKNIQGIFNPDKGVLSRWRSPEDPGDGKNPVALGPVTYGVMPAAANNFWGEDASFLRISNLALGYTFPKIAFVQNCRLYFSIQNLALFTNYSGANPEVNKNGVDTALAPGCDFTNYPLARTYTLGINLSF